MKFYDEYYSFKDLLNHAITTTYLLFAFGKKTDTNCTNGHKLQKL